MICYLGLGSNLGDRKQYIAQAQEKLANHEQIEIRRTSSIIETKPYGVTDQPNFLNCVLEIETELPAESLLEYCLQIEKQLGRIRTRKWSQRTIDIDILFYGDKIICSELLTVPHPEIPKRKFVLDSLIEICPEFVHPVLNKKIKDIYEELK